MLSPHTSAAHSATSFVCPTSVLKKAVSAVKRPVADPLAGVRLIVTLKDGSNFERPMSDVLRFTANRGTLLVIGKDGKIVRYLLTDIASITMQ